MPKTDTTILTRPVTRAALSGAAIASLATPQVHAAGSDLLKIALIGCGGRGTGAAMQALSTQGAVQLWAMADIFHEKIDLCHENLTRGIEGRYDRESTDGFGDKINVPRERQFVGFDAYKDAIDSGVDVVLLTTFPHFRPEQFEYAVKKGVNVFQEKPLGVDAPGIRRILAANEIAKQKNLKVGVGLQRHHNPIYEEIMPRLHDGAIGQPLLLECYWNSSSSGGLKPREPGETEMEFQLHNRYYFTWLCGDHNVEQHIHNIDVCNWIMQDHPIRAEGMGGRQYRNGREHGEIFDHHCVQYTYPSGATMYSMCRQMPGCWPAIYEVARGEKGIASLNQRVSKIQGPDIDWKTAPKQGNPYQLEHDALFDAIRNNKPYNETEYGAKSTMTAIMGRMATYSGKVVDWETALGSELSLAPDRYAMDGTPPVLPDADGVYPCAMPGTTKPW